MLRNRLLVALLITVLSVGIAFAGDEISGTFKITANGKLIGAEKFTITFESDGRITANSHGTSRQDTSEAKDYTRLTMRALSGPIHTYQREIYVSQSPPMKTRN